MQRISIPMKPRFALPRRSIHVGLSRERTYVTNASGRAVFLADRNPVDPCWKQATAGVGSQAEGSLVLRKRLDGNQPQSYEKSYR